MLTIVLQLTDTDAHNKDYTVPMCRFLLTHCALFQEGSITQVACCPHDEDFIAIATRLEPLHEVKICFILTYPQTKFTPCHLLPLSSSAYLCVWLCCL